MRDLQQHFIAPVQQQNDHSSIYMYVQPVVRGRGTAVLAQLHNAQCTPISSSSTPLQQLQLARSIERPITDIVR